MRVAYDLLFLFLQYDVYKRKNVYQGRTSAVGALLPAACNLTFRKQ
jgi:hypothetical protein